MSPTATRLRTSEVRTCTARPVPATHSSRRKLRIVSASRGEAQHEPQADWRTYRAKLVALERQGVFGTGQPYSNKKIPFSHNKWAHPLAQAETGCLLLSKRENMDFFHRAVVYIVQHEDSRGTLGYILNKPSPLYIHELALKGACPEVVDVFGEQRLYVGGPVSPEVISILHTNDMLPDCKNTRTSSPGNLITAAQEVAQGFTDPREYRLLAGHAGWAPYQLAYEVAMGCWYVVAASQELMLPPPGSDARSGEEMWRQILDLAGVGPSWQPVNTEPGLQDV